VPPPPAKIRAVALAVLLAILTPLSPSSAQVAADRFKLRVVLFKYIPDAAGDRFAALTARIRHEFEAMHKDVELDLRSFDIPGDTLDLYGAAPFANGSIANLLSRPPASGGYHLAEIDTVILGDLIEQDVIRPWPNLPRSSDWHPAGARAVTVGGEIFAIPHWLCGHFVFARDPQITSARTGEALIAALEHGAPKTPRLAGRLTGSWNVPSLYLDGYADSYGANSLLPALSIHLDPAALSNLEAFAKECLTGGRNPCVNGDYDDPDVPTAAFAAGKAAAMFGYSERLFLIRKSAPRDQFHISSAPIGNGNHPLLFTDAFVLRKDCTGPCEAAARAFAEYMNSPRTQEWILMSKDAANPTVPRYLLPATLSAFQTPEVRRDPYYRRLASEIKAADPFPNFGINKVHGDMRKKLMEFLTEPE
jgi:thiamine pyridinylase